MKEKKKTTKFATSIHFDLCLLLLQRPQQFPFHSNFLFSHPPPAIIGSPRNNVITKHSPNLLPVRHTAELARAK